MYREQDAGLVAVQAEAQSRKLAEVESQLAATQRELYAMRRASRTRRAINVGSLVGTVGALAGGVLDAYVSGALFGVMFLVVGWGLGAMLGLQGEIEPRPQDAPPARTTHGGG